MVTSVHRVPLKPKAQTLTIQLGSVTYNLTLRWNSMNAAWTLDIADAARAPIVQGIPLVTGLDLLAPYRYLGFQGALIVQTDNDPTAVPTFENLGKTGRLYFVVP